MLRLMQGKEKLPLPPAPHSLNPAKRKVSGMCLSGQVYLEGRLFRRRIIYLTEESLGG